MNGFSNSCLYPVSVVTRRWREDGAAAVDGLYNSLGKLVAEPTGSRQSWTEPKSFLMVIKGAARGVAEERVVVEIAVRDSANARDPEAALQLNPV